MFATIFTLCLAALASTTVLATPINRDTGLTARDGHVQEWPSFNRWGGHESLNGFDDFYGQEDFTHHKFNQVFVKEKEVLVCRRVDIVVIQQRLTILQEMAKKIITETICEVETQVIAFEQFHGSLGWFGRDLRRVSDHRVGYDHEIAGHFKSIIHDDGYISDHDLGFNGHDVGRNVVVVGGHNWDDNKSHISVNDAWEASRYAYGGFSDYD